MSAINWPTLPNGKPVPEHRKSWKAQFENKPVFCASSWRPMDGMGAWTCGYCQRRSTDVHSPNQPDTIANCIHCGYANRISL